MFEEHSIFNTLVDSDLLFEKSIEAKRSKLKSTEWEISRSSLSKLKKNVSYDDCKFYACNDIANNLNHISLDLPFIIDLPKGSIFNFLVRVGTGLLTPNDVETYYNQFSERDYISFSTISNKNVSHYGMGGNILFAYNITPDLIVHIFPMDCDSNCEASEESDITIYPSLWLTLKELNAATLKLKTYNQITCKTKKDGQILKPCRIIAINKITDEILSIAKKFGIGITIVHPDKKAICETYDPFIPFQKKYESKRKALFHELEKLYSL